MKNKNIKGLSLLELLLVVSVGILLILAGLAIFRNINNQRVSTDAVRLLTTLKQETQKLYQGEALYGDGDFANVLINAGAVPPANINANRNRILLPWGATGRIRSASANNRTAFRISFDDVPTAICVNIGISFTDDDSDFRRLDINGDTIVPTLDAVSDACDADENDMVWWFN